MMHHLSISLLSRNFQIQTFQISLTFHYILLQKLESMIAKLEEIKKRREDREGLEDKIS
jgi:hypothetical protein